MINTLRSYIADALLALALRIRPDAGPPPTKPRAQSGPPPTPPR